MIPLQLAAVADVVAGDLVDDDDATRRCDGVTIDSRTAAPGALFVPVAGEHADGHAFVPDAVERGAAGWLHAAARERPRLPGGVVVDDPADALLGLGAWLRDEIDPDVVAVTGSNGKTTTKDLCAAALGAARRVVANVGSYNNELGVPLTCTRLERTTEVLVCELGSRGRGHIARLIPVVRPGVAVVTTVAGAHLETFGTLEDVARAKAELVEGLTVDGVAVLNADDPRVLAMARVAPGRVVTYGIGADADLRAEDVELDPSARATFRVRGTTVRTPLPGRHMVGNALAALAVAEVLGVDLAVAAGGLAGAPMSPWRMEVLHAAGGPVVLNDAYNANPASVEAALATLSEMAVRGRRWAVLGAMAELGRDEVEGHRAVGRVAAALRIDGLVVVGRAAAPIAEGAALAGFDGDGGVTLVEDREAALEHLRARTADGDVVLVKASRSQGLEAVAAALAGEGAS